jgi:NADPH:quinone reductase
MKSVIVTRHGGPEVLEVQEVPVPEPGTGEVLVRVKAAGINYADIMQRHGFYPNGPTPPFGAGFEIAGIVEKTGEGVSQWSPGQEVMGFCSGGYSEYAVAPAAQLMPKPEQLSFHEAVALPCQGLTAYHALFTLGRLQEGQTVLLQAAAGGLGTLMVQMARNAGATVIGNCGTAEKCALLRELGCQHPVNYTDQDFVEEVQRITGGGGCDLIVETVGGEVFDKSMRCLKTRGMLITLGLASAQPPTPVKPLDLLVHNTAVAGFHLFAYTADTAAMAKALRDFHHWILDGKLNIITKHAYPLEEAVQAQQLVAGRQSVGKVALLP